MTIEELVALKGGKFVDSTITGTNSTNYRYAVVNADAVFSALTDTDDNDIVAEWGISGKTITSGMVLAPASGKQFKTVTITTGSVLLIKL